MMFSPLLPLLLYYHIACVSFNTHLITSSSISIPALHAPRSAEVELQKRGLAADENDPEMAAVYSPGPEAKKKAAGVVLLKTAPDRFKEVRNYLL
jgi:hypothetical protein